MRTSTRTKTIVAVIAAITAIAAIAPAVPAGASTFESRVQTSQAAPQGDQGTIVLHRDSSQATPFVADLSDQSAAPNSAVAGDGFDWGDAAIGAGAGLLAAALLLGGSGAVQARRRRTPSPAGMTSQGV